MSDEKPRCHNCGERVSGRGARPADGRRYCSKRDCRAARDRASYARRVGDPDLETRDCSRCGASLPHRARRSTDSPLGRWCQKTACQEDRRRVLSPAEMENHRARYLFIKEQHARFFGTETEECPRCGRPDARQGFYHPWEQGIGGVCFELGDEVPQPMPPGYLELFDEEGAR